MGYQIEIIEEVVVVKYSGSIDALLITRQLQDPEFFKNILKLGKVIYDYSDAEEVLTSLDDYLTYARIASSQNYLIKHVACAIVVNEALGRNVAEAYKKELESRSDWQLSITDTLEQALYAVHEIAKQWQQTSNTPLGRSAP